MSISATIHRNSQKPCGCSSIASCGCQKQKTNIDGSFSRPNFFAGQMLTDEDLRDAMNYMVQKNRLHNRHLFGEGVVCGLQVDPHPCPEDRHKVIVRKGHAINGCGDDIVAPRDQELDIVKMAYELLQRNRGYGCDDPCRDRQFAESDVPRLRKDLADLNIQRQLTVERTEIANLEKRITELQKSLKNSILQATPVKYGLYVRYTERQSDFVTPYQNDTCTTTRCQGSRIREGYEFELRCHESRAYPTIKQIIDQCANVLPDFEKIQGTTLHAICSLETVEKVVVQYKTLESKFPSPPAQPQDDLKAALMTAISNLEKKLSDTSIPPDTSTTKLLEPSVQREAIEAIHQLVILAFRSRAFQATSGFPLTELAGVFNITTTAAPSDPTEPKLVTKCKLLVHTKSVSSNLAGVASGMIDLLVERLLRLKTLLEKPDDFKVDFDAQSSAVGELIHADIVFRSLRALDANNKRLLSLMASGEVAFVPELRSLMYQVQLGVFSSPEDLIVPSRFAKVKTQAETVNRAVSEVTRQCMCRAILPPVPTDSSSSVLIANVTVNDCEVIEICNLARRFVMSGPALRYWFSEFDGIFGSLRKSCCPGEDSLAELHRNEEARLFVLKRNWQDSVEANVVSPIVDDAAKVDYADNAVSWARLHAAVIPEPERSAVTPNARVVDALSAFREFTDPVTGERRDNHQQEMSQLLAQMAVRPDTDLRNLLAWSVAFTSPAEVIKIAKDAEGNATLAGEKASDAVSKIAGVEVTADNAKKTADDASEVATTVMKEAKAANSKADTAIQTGNDAKTEAATATKAATEAGKTAKAAEDSAGKANVKAADAQKVADAAEKKVLKAQFDHDNNPGNDDRTVDDVVTLIRGELQKPGNWTVPRIKKLLEVIVNG